MVMENKEFAYKGFVLNGFLALLLTLAILGCAIYCFVLADATPVYAIPGILLLLLFALCMNGFIKLEPNAPVGIIVDAVKEVVTLTDNNIDAASRSSTNNDPSYINGIGKTGGTLISLLDLNVVISEKETA